MNTCKAKTRSGNPCRLPKGWGTEHVGKGRCKLHGGCGGAPIKHGLYSKYRENLVGQRICEILEDPDLLDMRRPVALIQALTEKLLKDAVTGGLINEKTRAALLNLATEESKAIERYYRTMEGTKHTIRVENIHVFLGQVAVIINEEVADAALRARIAERLGGLHILPD